MKNPLQVPTEVLEKYRYIFQRLFFTQIIPRGLSSFLTNIYLLSPAFEPIHNHSTAISIVICWNVPQKFIWWNKQFRHNKGHRSVGAETIDNWHLHRTRLPHCWFFFVQRTRFVRLIVIWNKTPSWTSAGKCLGCIEVAFESRKRTCVWFDGNVSNFTRSLFTLRTHWKITVFSLNRNNAIANDIIDISNK